MVTKKVAQKQVGVADSQNHDPVEVQPSKETVFSQPNNTTSASIETVPALAMISPKNGTSEEGQDQDSLKQIPSQNQIPPKTENDAVQTVIGKDSSKVEPDGAITQPVG